MKKFIKRNSIICLFAFISILISLSYAITYNMPDYLGIEGWYSLFNNISISYIAAFIFYILQVYKPECDNSKKAQLSLEPLFKDLIEFIEVTIACCRKYVSINENDSIIIDWQNKEQQLIYFVPTIEGANKEHRPAIKKSKSELSELEKIYKSKIKEIKERIDFKECDSDILSAFSKLEATDFFKSIVNAALMLEGTFIKFPNFQKGVDNFELIKNEFKDSCGITTQYTIRDAENIEVAACEAIFHNKALLAKSIDEFNEITYKEFLKIQLQPYLSDEEQLTKLIDDIFSDVMKKRHTN